MCSIPKRLFALSSALLVAGCISPRIDRPAALQAYRTAQSCCASLATARVEPLPYGSLAAFQIDQQDQAFDFGSDGISFFKLFVLPAQTSAYACELSSYSSGDGHDLNVFFPKAALLDEKFSVIRQTSDADFRGAEPTSSKMGGVGVRVEITPKDNARYFVIHTSKTYVENGRSVQLVPKGPFLGAGAVPYVASTLLDGNGLVHFVGTPVTLPGNLEILCSAS
jgi:hypothetical protein